SGCDANVSWLQENHGRDAIQIIKADLTDFEALKSAAARVQRIYHLAGQVAVTTSVVNPRQDFEANALGTFNVLEAARQVGDDPIILYASTNKVYGGMEEIEIVEQQTRY
ncbi:MAG: NAD-dependent epimerase/dehydratase family protein, partial [Aliifodinibius sp.]|nr:NAD-dependent epimerase/dehydratase family protein [Fodinibius sp.]NIV11831.1 NAD-dependent epimerase/dehydratase family protein [Fodinibius sp.]NIY26183.1 NAD-dependent epimerase/dehydratase family protein [Fodinibius sp.]